MESQYLMIQKSQNVSGYLSPQQILRLKETIEQDKNNPSLLSDLEGCGPVASLESDFAKFVHANHAIAVSSGTSAIHVALLACGVKPDDEVIVPPYTWPQTVAPVVFIGAKPVFADIDPYTWHLDPDQVASKISPKTKAILVVHLFGHVANMSALENIASKKQVYLIADAVQSLGAFFKNRQVARWGDIACFSLGRGKLVEAGEGGLLTTNDPELYERSLLLSQHPERVKRELGPAAAKHAVGLNARLHPLVALLAISSLQNANVLKKKRNDVFNAFIRALNESKTMWVKLQKTLPEESPVAYGIPMTLKKEITRSSLLEMAQKHGIPLRSGPVGEPLHIRLRKSTQFGGSENLSNQSCPVAERRCNKEELWAMSNLDMDLFTEEEAYQIGQKLVSILSEI